MPAPARWVAALLAVAALAANTVILLSDRAPGLLRRLSDRLDVDVGTIRMTAAQVGPGSEVPRSDFVVHFALWAVAAALVGLAAGRTRSKVLAVGVVLLYSAGLELAQGELTYSRTPQPLDILANAVGGAAGLAFSLAVGFLLWCRPARRRRPG